MFKSLLYLVTMMLPLSLAAGTAPADPLSHLAEGHPRLLALAPDFANLRAGRPGDPLHARVVQHLLAEAELCLGEGLVEHKLVGPRLLFQSRAALRRILNCAMAYHLTGDTRFSRRAIQEMHAAAAMPDWNPSHFLDVAEMAAAVAIGYDWLFNEMSPEEREPIRRALVEKALRFASDAYETNAESWTDVRFWWVSTVNNWNQVCNGGLLAAALAVADEEPELARLTLAGVRRSLPRALAAYAPDGGYPEGPGYWEYGTGYHVFALAMLETAFGDRFGLDAGEGFQQTALYRLAVQGPTGSNFNYADGTPDLSFVGQASVYAWMARHFGPPATLADARGLIGQRLDRLSAEELRKDRFLALQALWLPSPDAPPAEPLPLDFHFRGPADIALFRSAWNDPRAIFVGFKAGANAVNHGHLDLGSFILDADGVRWALDLGLDNYNLPGYFEYNPAARWSYYRLVNLSHNTLTLDGALQDTQAVAPITDFGSTPERAFATADLSPAHAGFTGKHFRRISLLDRSRVLIEDDLTGVRAGTRARWAMVTQATIEIGADGRTAVLRQQDRTLRATLLSPMGATFAEASTKPPKAEENQNDGTRLLAVDCTFDQSEAKISILLAPEGPHWPAPAVTP